MVAVIGAVFVGFGVGVARAVADPEVAGFFAVVAVAVTGISRF